MISMKIIFTIPNITITTVNLFIIVMVINSPVHCPRNEHHTAPSRGCGEGQHLILVMITIIAATLFILIIITITMTTSIDAQGVPDGVMDTYCWLHSTFTLPHLGVVEIDNVNGVDQVFS